MPENYFSSSDLLFLFRSRRSAARCAMPYNFYDSLGGTARGCVKFRHGALWIRLQSNDFLSGCEGSLFAPKARRSRYEPSESFYTT